MSVGSQFPSRFACVRHGLCFWKCLRRNFALGAREAFSRDWKSHQTSKESLARSNKSPYCQPDMESQLYFSCSLMSANTCFPVRLFIPSSCHNFGCVSSEVSGGLSSSRTAKPRHFSSQFEQWRRRWEQFAKKNLFLCSPESFLQNEKWRNMLRSDVYEHRTFAIVMDCYTNNFPGLPRLKKLVADKHVITELPLVPFVIINLTSLTASVCRKVRFKSKVTRGFSFGLLRDSNSPLRGSLTRGKIKKNLWDQGYSFQ